MRFALISIALLTLAVCLPAQNCTLVHDINQVPRPLDSSPELARTGPGNTSVDDGMLKVGGFWYLTAVTTATGRELWKTDGTATGTTLVKDIQPGPPDADLAHLTVCDGKLYFSADDGTSGVELWTSDGTASGTRLVKDIRAGSGGSSPAHFACLNKKLYFAASDGSGSGGSGTELWVSDGTASGTTLLADIQTGSSSSNPMDLRANPAGTAIYFAADDGTRGVELWATDGTASGTALLKDIASGTGDSSPTHFQILGATTLFVATGANGRELWKTDGTASGTVEVKDIRAGSTGSDPNLFFAAILGGSLLFGADDGVNGTELWNSDGTATGTTLVANLQAGSSSSSPSDLFVNGSTAFFSAFTTGSGRELWKSDGTPTGTLLLKDVFTGTSSGAPSGFAKHGTKTVFSAFVSAAASGNGRELWVTDGTPTGTTELADIFAGPESSSPHGFTALSATRLGFFAQDSTLTGPGREVFETDGTTANTKLLKDIHTGATASSSPSELTACVGGVAYLAANDGVNGGELWRLDASGASLVRDIETGAGGSFPAEFTCCWTGTRSITVFAATDTTNGRELWTTDGTAGGTTLLKDLRTGSFGSYPTDLVCAGNRIYFRATTAAGTELWCTDGTTSGTVLVKDIRPGPGSAFPTELTNCKGILYFAANDGTNGTELWRSDGSSTGTFLVHDLHAGSPSSTPVGLVCCGDRVAFRGYTAATGSELFVSNGTSAGTVLVAEIQSGSSSGFPSELVWCQDALFFTANDGTNGTELWKSNLTAAGTALLGNLAAGTASSSPSKLTCAGNKVFFTARVTGVSGRELYCTDGTATGTAMVKDLRPGVGSSNPSYLTSAGAGIFFVASVPATAGGDGTELWFSDGTATGTVQHCDLRQGPSSSHPQRIVINGGVVYFAADDGRKGTEIHRIQGTPGTVERPGEGCGPNHVIFDCTNPVIGKPFLLKGRSAPAGIGLLIAGLPSSPIQLSPLLLPDCALYVGLVGFDLIPVPSGSSWDVQTLMPNTPNIVGLAFAMQVVYGTPGQLSNPLLVTIGK